MSGAFGIAQNSAGNGLQARDLRKIIQGVYPNTGIIKGGTVKGNQNLTYRIEETVGVVSRGASDGASVFYLAASNTPAVAAGTALSRIDSIWVKAKDPELDGDVYGVDVGVTQGTPSQNPVRPSIDPTATRIIDMLVKPYTTNLATGATVNGSYDYSIPYGASLGRLNASTDTRPEVAGDATVRKWFYELPTRFYVPTDRVVEFMWDGDVSYAKANWGDWMSYATEFVLDGKRVEHSARETYCPANIWIHNTNRVVQTVAKGDHSLQIKVGIAAKSGNGEPHFHYGESNGLNYPGRTLQIWDRGVSR